MKFRFKTVLMVLVICTFQIFNLIFVSADSANITTDVTDNSVKITGTLSAERAKTDLIVRMKDSMGNDVLAEFTTSYFKNDEVVFAFDKILLPKTLISDDYTFEITGGEISSPIVMPYKYIGPDKILQILTLIRDAQNVGGVLKANAEDLSLDITDYDLLTDEGKILFESVMGQVEYDLPDDYTSDADKAKIRTETQKLFTAYNNAVCLALFESIQETSDVTAWIDRYYEVLGFNNEDNTTDYSEESITSYMQTVKTDDTFTEKLKAAQSLDTTDKIKTYLYESALLSVIAEKRSSVVKDMMLEFTDLFNIDLDTLRELSVSNQSTCFTNITGKVYNSYAKASEALNDEIVIVYRNTHGTTSTGGSGGGGSISIGSNMPSSSNDTSEKQAVIFSDMPSEHWAYNAAQLLCERGIINGKGDGTFAPDANITRAEFVKMITVAMSLRLGETNSSFSDVPSDAWYAPYAAAAYNEGIVLGDNSGRFNPDEQITRQDMVTILYRAMKIKDTESQINFADAWQISAYAKNAVAYFSSKGIVNGMGDGRFAPYECATRAQAAQILYNIITS